MHKKILITLVIASVVVPLFATLAHLQVFPQHTNVLSQLSIGPMVGISLAIPLITTATGLYFYHYTKTRTQAPDSSDKASETTVDGNQSPQVTRSSTDTETAPSSTSDAADNPNTAITRTQAPDSSDKASETTVDGNQSPQVTRSSTDTETAPSSTSDAADNPNTAITRTQAPDSSEKASETTVDGNQSPQVTRSSTDTETAPSSTSGAADNPNTAITRTQAPDSSDKASETKVDGNQSPQVTRSSTDTETAPSSTSGAADNPNTAIVSPLAPPPPFSDAQPQTTLDEQQPADTQEQASAIKAKEKILTAWISTHRDKVKQLEIEASATMLTAKKLEMKARKILLDEMRNKHLNRPPSNETDEQKQARLEKLITMLALMRSTLVPRFMWSLQEGYLDPKNKMPLEKKAQREDYKKYLEHNNKGYRDMYKAAEWYFERANETERQRIRRIAIAYFSDLFLDANALDRP